MSDYAFIDFDYLKDVLEIDERDKARAELLILSVCMGIENHIQRIVSERSVTEYHDGYGQAEIVLREYPVKEITALYCSKERVFAEADRVKEDYYSCDLMSADEAGERQSTITLKSGYYFPKARGAVKIVYAAGYKKDEVPEDMKTAAVEYFDWQFKRLKARQIGVAGLINEKRGRERALLEKTMPEHVKDILTNYRRKYY